MKVLTANISNQEVSYFLLSKTDATSWLYISDGKSAGKKDILTPTLPEETEVLVRSIYKTKSFKRITPKEFVLAQKALK